MTTPAFMTWLCGLLVGWGLLTTDARGHSAPPGILQHGQAPLPGIGGELNLRDQRGQRFSWQQLGDTPALVFFGFTRCASTCPVALHQARQVLGWFQGRAAPTVIFVTLDPLSDDPASLGRYLSAIDPRIVGLSGSPAEIEQAASRYGVALRGQASAIEHSSRWYLVTRPGTVLRVYDNRVAPESIAQDLMRVQGHATLTSLRTKP